MNPIVAVIGRPNVGKSTFFNRITKSRDALVDDVPGVTRDRIYRDAVWDDVPFTVVDTGGFLESDSDPFAGHIRVQIEQAVSEADAVILLLDGKSGLSPFDRDLVELVRDRPRPVLVAVNKIDGEEQEIQLGEFYALGLEHIFPISAAHGYGVPDFLDALLETLPPSEPEPKGDAIRVAVVGRPNAGKSSLVNRLLGAERLVVSEIPGTTRDAVDTMLTDGGRSYRLVDTAGIRRKGKVRAKIEKFSIIKALKSLDRCDVALVVLDAGEGIADQDMTVAGYANDRGCGCILLYNKWDLVEKEPDTVRRRAADLRDATRFLPFAPTLNVSALTGLRVRKILRTVDEVHDQYISRIGTGQVNRIVEEAVTRNEPPMHKGKRLKFYYATQVASRPPTFVCFVNYPEAVHFSYQRYLTNQIREGTGLDKTPIRLLLRQRTGRIDFASRKSSDPKSSDRRRAERRKRRRS
jgi:GTPase